jgi:hypothetical protein
MVCVEEFQDRDEEQAVARDNTAGARFEIESTAVADQ